jgi:hypothetical protein
VPAARVVPSTSATAPAEGQPNRRQLAGQELGVGLGAIGAGAVLLQRDSIPIVLAVLRQQDQRRRVCGLCREQ